MDAASNVKPVVTVVARANCWTAVALYGTSAALSVLSAFFALELWRADLRVPFSYSVDGDGLYYLTLAKTVIETGWSSINPLLGAPGTFNQLDYPNLQALQDAAIFVLSCFSHNLGIVFNIYFLLTFPLLALTTTLAGRQMGMSPVASVFVAQLYTFQPFHMMRGEVHLQFSAYYAVPLVVPAIVAIARRGSLSKGERATGILGFALCALSNVYYAVFAGLFLLVAAVAGYLRRHDRQTLRSALKLAMILLVAFFTAAIPNLVHAARFGLNPMAAIRLPQDGDTYGLRLAQMLLPVPGHRISAWADFRRQYAAHAPLVNENESAALGVIGAFGVLVLLFRQCVGPITSGLPSKMTDMDPNRSLEEGKILDVLAMLLLAGLLFATVGGVGPTINYFGFTKIRSYNRISVFLGLFALLAVGLMLDRVIRNRAKGRPRLAAGVCALILILGLLDEISPRYVPRYEDNALEFQSDARFVASIEAVLPPGASIFQLPLMRYPDPPAIDRLGAYGLLRGYLHSSTLRWSYGAMDGRLVSDWQTKTVHLPPKLFLEQIRSAGFSGVYLDRAAFHTDRIEDELASVLGPPLISEDHRLEFFKIVGIPVAAPPSARRRPSP